MINFNMDDLWQEAMDDFENEFGMDLDQVDFLDNDELEMFFTDNIVEDRDETVLQSLIELKMKTDENKSI